MKNLMQPFVVDPGGVVRFRGNALVRYLLDHGGLNLNDLSRVPASQDDQEQFAQLIGYSLCGFHELSYVSDETATEASIAASKQLGRTVGGCRDQGCEIHIGVPREEY